MVFGLSIIFFYHFYIFKKQQCLIYQAESLSKYFLSKDTPQETNKVHTQFPLLLMKHSKGRCRTKNAHQNSLKPYLQNGFALV